MGEHPRQEGAGDHSYLVSSLGVSPLCLFQTQLQQLSGKDRKGRGWYPAEMASATTSAVPSSFLITRWNIFKGKFTGKVEGKQNKAPSEEINITKQIYLQRIALLSLAVFPQTDIAGGDLGAFKPHCLVPRSFYLTKFHRL